MVDSFGSISNDSSIVVYGFWRSILVGFSGESFSLMVNTTDYLSGIVLYRFGIDLGYISQTDSRTADTIMLELD